MCRYGSTRCDKFLAVSFPQFPPDVCVYLQIQRPHLVPQPQQLLSEVRGLVILQPVLGVVREVCSMFMRLISVVFLTVVRSCL
jgi:hypothetical protein